MGEDGITWISSHRFIHGHNCGTMNALCGKGGWDSGRPDGGDLVSSFFLGKAGALEASGYCCGDGGGGGQGRRGQGAQ